MAQPPLITLTDVRLAFGGKPLFEGVDVALSKGERAALVGRNGAGKSTLMRIVTGVHEPDSGEIWVQPGVEIVSVAQEPDLSGYSTVLDFTVDGLADKHRAEAELDAFGIHAGADPAILSGGQQRRAALAKAFARDPDILLLDEPTNHLDVPMIEALEDRLKAFKGVVLLVSHDRAFLESVSTTTLWLRQGRVFKSPRGYAHFDEWAEGIEQEEERALKKLKTQLADEQRWLARGVTGRRKRNQGRLARMKEMRAQHARLRSELNDAQGRAGLSADAGDQMSKKVIEARGLSKSFDTPSGPLPIVDGFSIRVLRGDRLGVIGPNGAGKTTLLKLLLGELEADSGSVKRSKVLNTAYLDQTRDSLRPKDTLWEAMAPNGGDHIMVQGRSRHVAAYGKDFLFKPEQLRQPVAALSGGERNRLTLAIALAQPSNMLVLDEPTNDLDMQTLDLLEEMLANYEGTLILVSHDRAFLDATVTSCLSPLGEGKWVQTPGGWSDAQTQLKPEAAKVSARKRKAAPTKPARPKAQTKLSFKDEHRLKEIDEALPRLQAEVRTLETDLADPNLFNADPGAFQAKSDRLAAAKTEIEQAEEDWLEIEARREALDA